jgi:hypothetical protein
MRRALLLAALLLVIPMGSAHTSNSFQTNTGPWFQWVNPWGACGVEHFGAGGSYTSVAVHGSNGLTGTLRVKYAEAREVERYDDPALPGSCGLYAWISSTTQHEVVDTDPAGLVALAPTPVTVTWHANGVAMMASGQPIVGTCTFQWWLAAGGPPTTSTATVNPSTGTCSFPLTVLPVPIKFMLVGDATVDTTSLGPWGPGYANYLKAHVSISDAAHNDEAHHCVEVAPVSPC